MYGKLFASTFTGSLCGSGPTVFAVWSYVIAHAVDSSVELNPRLLSGILGTDAKSVADAIEFLVKPDPESRNADHEGRRLIRDGQYQYRVVSHAIYRAMKSDDDRRAYNRDKQRESRERRQLSIRDVNDSQDNTDTNTGTDPKAVRTQEPSTYRTSDRNLMSSVLSENTAQPTTASLVHQKVQGAGALPAGSLPRDHVKHSVCGKQYRICIPTSVYAKFSRRYGPDDAVARPAIEGFVNALEVQIGDGSVGDFLWLEKHFDVWLIQSGRVLEPVKAKDVKQTTAEIVAAVKILHEKDELRRAKNKAANQVRR